MTLVTSVIGGAVAPEDVALSVLSAIKEGRLGEGSPQVQDLFCVCFKLGELFLVFDVV